jgi:hypothetical protein
LPGADHVVLEHLNGPRHRADLVASAPEWHLQSGIATGENGHRLRHRLDRARDAEQAEDRSTQRCGDGETDARIASDDRRVHATHRGIRVAARSLLVPGDEARQRRACAIVKRDDLGFAQHCQGLLLPPGVYQPPHVAIGLLELAPRTPERVIEVSLFYGGDERLVDTSRL